MTATTTTTNRPTSIALPPPQHWSTIENDPPFYTPPESPSIFYTPPTSPSQLADLSFPHNNQNNSNDSLNFDIPLDDEGLTTLEKIYLYSRSNAPFHRIFISHALPDYLPHVTPQEAVEYVLPLLSGLAMDDDESVKEALAAELVPVIWWFFSHCKIIPDDVQDSESYPSTSTTVTISVQAFTPILGTLLLSSNPLVGGAARLAVVELLSRMRKADQLNGAVHPSTTSNLPWDYLPTIDNDDDDDDEPIAVGLFGQQERDMFTHEILHQVVIGMGRLDVDEPPEVPEPVSPMDTPSKYKDSVNPYFPPYSPKHTPATSPSSSSTSHHWQKSPTLDSQPAHRQSPVSTSPQPPFSPGTEFPPPSPDRNTTPTKIHNAESSFSPPSISSPSGSFPPSANVDWDDNYDEGDDEQAAVGRLSSMSLMAAVTASGILKPDTQDSFVKEVERVGRDSVYWVRREASFALGALAKVVREDVVITSLLPLFNSLRRDETWHVRHSALFALPAILARLPPDQRREVALGTILKLVEDPNPTVRSGVLEALGEVIFTFHKDVDGPPKELVDLFIGRKEDKWVRDGDETHPQPNPASLSPLEAFYTDSKRPLICAFNFPAIVLTLGKGRWKEIREAYLDISNNPAPGVLRTLAASLGKVAEMIGDELSRQDLIEVWWNAITSDDEEVRLKVLEATHDFFAVIGSEAGKDLLDQMYHVWGDGILRSWRERELVQRQMVEWFKLLKLQDPSLLGELLVKGLEDSVASVREAAISTLPELWRISLNTIGSVDQLREDIKQMSISSNYRRRMTFIACQQALVVAKHIDRQPLISLESCLDMIEQLSGDTIEGVRIAVARLAAFLHGNVLGQSPGSSGHLQVLIDHISQDDSPDVRSYVANLPRIPIIVETDASKSMSPTKASRKRAPDGETFSRPPISASPSTTSTSPSVDSDSSNPNWTSSNDVVMSSAPSESTILRTKTDELINGASPCLNRHRIDDVDVMIYPYIGPFEANLNLMDASSSGFGAHGGRGSPEPSEYFSDEEESAGGFDSSELDAAGTRTTQSVESVEVPG
ncbi:armadillo-type protein, partial [Panaeolus papilionaceus]